MNSEHDDFREEEEDEPARSIFAAGWFRAVLVLTGLAIGVVVALPYLLDWFEPLPPPVKVPVSPAQIAEPPATPVPSPPVPAPQSPPAAAKPAPDTVRAAAPGPARIAPLLPPAAKPTAVAPSPSRAAVAAAKPDDTRAESLSGYWVQLGFFKEQKNAEALAQRLRGEGIPVQVRPVTRSEKGAAATGIEPATYHIVRAGAFRDHPQAMAARDELSQKGHAGFIIQGAAK